ncbi:MAG: hypothetical protein J6Y08_10840 [Clostridiales bacterium]|nr:hypothetical protein [Clostridiales bacterium]
MIAILLILAMLMGITGCGSSKTSDQTNREAETSAANLSDKDVSSDVSEENVEDYSDAQEFSYEVKDKNRRGIESVEVKLLSDITFEIDAYENVWSDSVPGIVGLAVDVYWWPEDYYESPNSRQWKDPDNILLIINYEEDKLLGVPEENLLLLYSVDDAFVCSEVAGAKLDVDKNQVTAEIGCQSGNYLLVDAYQWYKSQGMDASKYAYELPDEIKALSAWEKEHDTGSIMELMDREWMDDNAPIFHVSTPEQLASVVYYVNTTDRKLSSSCEVYLEADIDLEGYDWMPMGWISGKNGDVHDFCGLIDGQGHTINGLKLDCGHEDCGFVGYSKDLTMKNITFTNAQVSGFDTVGICVGQFIGRGVWENVHAQGNISIGEAAKEGGLAGWITELSFINCSAEYTLDGGSKVYHYLSYQEKQADEIGPHELLTITLNDDYSVSCNILEKKDGSLSGTGSLTWVVECDGVIIYSAALSRETLETEHVLSPDRKGSYKVYIKGYVEDVYMPISNILEFTI